MDAVSDRDFVVEVLAAVALGMVHLSRLAEELTWWSNPRFGFVRASDAFSTGSSIMPNKKNPDPAELVRGRAARVIGAVGAMLTLLKGLPLTYQRDLQEDKAALFDGVAVYEASLGILAGMLGTLAVDADRMRAAADEGYTTATAVADMPSSDAACRSAPPTTSSARSLPRRRWRVSVSTRSTTGWSGSPLARVATPRRASPGRRPGHRRDHPGAAAIDGALASCDVIGGTAPTRVAAALEAARERLGPGWPDPASVGVRPAVIALMTSSPDLGPGRRPSTGW